MRHWGIALLAVAAVGCGLAFSPGDYGGKSSASADAGTPGDAAVTDAATIDAASAAPLAHVLVLAGTDDAGAATSDVWTAEIAANGDLAPFVYNAPNAIPGPARAATIFGNVLFVSTYLGTARAVEGPTWDGGIVPDSYPRTTVTTPNPAGYGQFFAGSTLVAVGGVSTTTSAGSSEPVTTYDPSLDVTIVDGGGYNPTIASTTVLEAGVTDVVAATYKAFVYLVGSNADPNQAAQVYVGKLDPAAGAVDITATTPMTDPQTQTLHTPTRPMVCAGSGYLVVAGGAGSDVVLYAAIDEAAGTLGPWKAGPKLPTTLERAGCFIVNGRVYLAGGWASAVDSGVGAATSQILRYALDGNDAGDQGSEWEVSASSLPAPRLNVLALPF